MHFTLWVTNTDEWNLDELMEPYSQDTQDERYVETDTMVNGDIFSIKDYIGKQFVHEVIQLDYWQHQTEGETPKSQINWHTQSIKRLTQWAVQTEKDLDWVKQEICDYEGWELLDNGDLGETYNHNMEWDWWVIGGRWDRCLVMKDGTRRNVFKKSQLDFDKTIEYHKEEAARQYDETVKQGKENGWPEKNWFWGWEKLPTKEEYIEANAKFWWPYAILDNDEWINNEQRDESGATWEEYLQEWFDNLPDDTEITLVDYHM